MDIISITMSDAEIFIQYINDNYDKLKWKYFRLCKEKQMDWDEDIYQETILRCFETIKKNGKMQSTTPYGIESYFFKAFQNNVRNEKRYCRERLRDRNITSDNINEVYEEWFNNNFESSRTKIINCLFKDFSILYIMATVEQNFDANHFYLYRMKTLVPNITYKKLREMTGDKDSRNKVIEVSRFVKENVKKEDIKKAFQEIYGDLIYE